MAGPKGRKRHCAGTATRATSGRPKPQKNDLHPTMKPVELVERAIREPSRPGDVGAGSVYGSGTPMPPRRRAWPSNWTRSTWM